MRKIELSRKSHRRRRRRRLLLGLQKSVDLTMIEICPLHASSNAHLAGRSRQKTPSATAVVYLLPKTIHCSLGLRA